MGIIYILGWGVLNTGIITQQGIFLNSDWLLNASINSDLVQVSWSVNL